MNQLCVPVPSAADTHQILQDVFTLCRIPWIYDFIFRADPAADITMLQAPVQKRHALSARIFVHATETSSRYAHTFDFNKELLFYSIPAFSIGPITAGFCVEQPAHLAKRDARDSLQCIRFIRDDHAGVFLHVSENETTGVTEVDCLTHKSSIRRTRVRMKFDLHSLRSVLRTARGILYPADIAPSLIYLNVSDEKRACPVCKDPTATHCECVLPLHRPTHPLDFQFEASNMGLYTGFYQGATVVRLCSAGHGVINATLQSGSVIQGELNAEITSRMHKMAVVDRLSKVKERPASMVMPASPLNLSAMIAGDVLECASALANEIDENGEPKSTPLDAEVLFDPTPDVAPTPDVVPGDLDGASVLMDTGEMLVNLNEENVESPNSQTEKGLPAVSGLIELELEDGCERSSAEVEDESGGEGRDAEIIDDLGGAQKRARANDVSSPGSFGGERLTARSIADRCASWVSRSSKRTGRYAEEKSTSPETKWDEENGQSNGTDAVQADSGGTGAKTGTSQARTSTATSGPNDKAEIRKKRNREAAARSNLKRKLRNERVRKDLASLTQRAIRLQIKERMCREENTRLRNALQRAGGKYHLRR